jgi:hypothetical protein
MSLQMLPVVAADEITVDEANALMVAWAHPLGACERPFEQRAHALAIDGEVVAATIGASTVSATCGGQARGELVELARIVRHPDYAWVLRVMLRLWRAVLIRDWQSWPVLAAVSYAMPGTPGDIYRFDGWERVGATRSSAGGGTWSNRPAVNDIGDGVKTLWRYQYAPSLVS